MQKHGSTTLRLGLVEVSHPLAEQDPCKDSPSHHNPTTFAKQVLPLMTRNLDHAHNEKRPVSPSWKNVRGCVAISVDWALFDKSFTKHVIKNGWINGEWFSSSPVLPVPSIQPPQSSDLDKLFQSPSAQWLLSSVPLAMWLQPATCHWWWRWPRKRIPHRLLASPWGQTRWKLHCTICRFMRGDWS